MSSDDAEEEENADYTSQKGEGQEDQQDLIFTKEQQMKLLALLQQSESQHSQSIHTANQIVTQPTSGKVFSCSTNLFEWILDTGATDHVCFSLSKFHSYKKIRPISVQLPNGNKIVTETAGTIIFSNDFFLTNVLYIPQFSFNLISVSKLISHLECQITFSATACVIQDQVSLRKIGVAELKNGLYTMQLGCSTSGSSPWNESFPVPFTSTVTCKSNANSDMWHARLGHPSSEKLKILHSQFPFISCNHVNKHCEICHFAKMKRLPFPISSSKSDDCFDLIHVDIWGPFSVPSVFGHKYFLTIVDDKSRFTWINFMKLKSETQNLLQSFVNMVKLQFNKSIKAIRSDNGREFLMTDFFKSTGILHQTSCPETPQQNAVVERKHQHILNIARSLVFQSNLPICFWNFAIGHAVFILNRLPSLKLDKQCPYQLLHNALPTLTHLRVFGSLCYATTQSA